MTSASNYYIAHSTPSPHTSGAASPNPGAVGVPHTSSSSSTPPPPPPSRTLLLLQSPTTRSHLTSIYAVSGSAVKLSHKAAAAAERLIQRAVGADKGKGRASTLASAAPTPPPSPGKPPLPSRSRGPSPVPPPATPDKPPLPARQVTSPAGSRGPSPRPPSAPPQLPLRTRTRAALSATLILASLSASTVRLMDAGGAAVSAAVSHRYGEVAGDNAALAASTMRNVVLVYVDVRGFGRRALVKRTAKTWAKGHSAEARGGVGG
jgi:spartin